jgi:putative transcriptional regulator
VPRIRRPATLWGVAVSGLRARAPGGLGRVDDPTATTMLHECYESIYATAVGRRPKAEEPVFSRIESLRLERGLSRQELADAVGVHYQTVGYLERGDYSPSLSLALRLAETLEAPVDDIFSLTPFPNTLETR